MVSAHFEVVVVGAGPAGMAAATIAAEAGRRVCLLDGNAAPGGQIWRGTGDGTADSPAHGASYRRWKARLDASGCVAWQGWQVVDRSAPGWLRLESDEGCREIGFEHLILATGARERFLPFPGWTLPGVMGVGGAQALVKSGLDVAGKRVVVAGSGPLLLAVAASLARAGAKIAGVFEQASRRRLASFVFSALAAHPGKALDGLRYRLATAGVPYHGNAWIRRAEGQGRVERVWAKVGGVERAIPCDLLACGFHLVPNLELPRLLGCEIEEGRVRVDALQQSSVRGVACVGELTGIGGLEKALVEGEIAGWAAGGYRARPLALAARRRRQLDFVARMDRAFALRPELRNLPEDSTIVCRCEDVTHGELGGLGGWREARLHARCGMGPCQGRVCGAATEFLYGWGATDARPPVYPARVSTLAAETDAGGMAGR